MLPKGTSCIQQPIWDYPIARMYADNRVARIYAGTNEIMKILIARGLFKELFQHFKAKKNNKLKL